jgi:hypothetical protein
MDINSLLAQKSFINNNKHEKYPIENIGRNEKNISQDHVMQS